jgi:hypothetical protein
MVRGVQVVCHNMTIAYILRIMLQLVTHSTAHWHATQGYILEHRACGFVSPSYLSSVPPPPHKVAPDAAREVPQVSVSVLHVFECNRILCTYSVDRRSYYESVTVYIATPPHLYVQAHKDPY